MSDGYVREKLGVAMRALSVSTDTLQARLRNAGVSSLIRLTPDDFADPGDKAVFADIMESLTCYGAGGEAGTIDTTTRELDDEAALEVADKIVDLHLRYLLNVA